MKNYKQSWFTSHSLAYFYVSILLFVFSQGSLQDKIQISKVYEFNIQVLLSGLKGKALEGMRIDKNRGGMSEGLLLGYSTRGGFFLIATICLSYCMIFDHLSQQWMNEKGTPYISHVEDCKKKPNIKRNLHALIFSFCCLVYLTMEIYTSISNLDIV